MVRPTEWTLERYNTEVAPLFLETKSVAKVAKKLNMNRSNLYRIMSDLKITPPITKQLKEIKARRNLKKKDKFDKHL